ncbi:SIR2 family protein [Mesorhizobium muleiense]|uniref:SIR2 family protein n=1 Tax=Mesorhizobium muleiense TaxID=1004279 RepID=UPI001F21C5F6|nr:SIR2 family protein [Mesorhizobium muleiense]MCF6116870.1 SIR2 family protein [Mesorhizobium muleiense]
MVKRAQSALLKEAPRAIAHLRSQYRRRRLGLIFGSGIGKDLNFPDWIELVDRMARHPSIDAVDMINRFKEQGSAARPITRSLASVTQMLFSHYRARSIEQNKLKTPLSFVEEQNIKTTWLKVLHEELYKDLSKTARRKKINSHPYLKSFMEIIKSTPLTVNYNFDDSLEQMLLQARNEREKDTTRGYEATDRPRTQFQRETAVIYHPNGYLPSTFSDGASSEVVFSDDAFQDQIISAATGKYLNLSNHLFSNTCLLIGLSLEDATLQSLLRQNAVSSPGNIHYVVQFTPSTSSRDREAEAAIFRANFESFNLYTLFLDQAGIEALSDLIKMEPTSFKMAFEKNPPKFVYYLVGSVGAGKSTAAANFRNLTTYDEWIDERKPGLAKPEDSLSRKDVGELDSWIAEQFRKKNFALADCFDGIHIVDRAPLDPLTFGPPKARPTKAKRLLNKITDGGARKLARGHIIYLQSCVEDVRVRCSFKHKYWPDEKYQELIDNISEIYSELPYTTITTGGRDAGAVAKEIARVIFMETYSPADIGNELKRYSEMIHD